MLFSTTLELKHNLPQSKYIIAIGHLFGFIKNFFEIAIFNFHKELP